MAVENMINLILTQCVILLIKATTNNIEVRLGKVMSYQKVNNICVNLI